MLGYLGLGTVSGAEIDELFAGPNRPLPKPSYDPRGSPSVELKREQGPSVIKAASDSMSSGVSDLYNRLGSALAERGQKLGELEETFSSLEQGSKGMLAQAQKLAAQQSAKKWFAF
ncbi:uncharacterized protein FIBRA_05891 [Fibroporia radiculosa]|uniref:V-SNARE coiled-coil homology domain-containing protein n=1 Tax=Fibroporia radiculosa TaxID=599839 RepID=J4GRT3_9APHY|nr:uncharacterized protein FIBRA_05891 [Fibroporia radiculosa]CCM03745.1 predicted protein [Fibroporia radiculosa]